MDEQIKQTKLRKYRDILYIVGTAFIIFGAWSLIQLFLYLTIRRDEMDLVAEASGFSGMIWLFYVILAAAVVIDVVLHFYIGLSARSESKTGKRHRAYIVLTFIPFITYLGGLLLTVLSISEYALFTYVASILIYLTSLFFCFEIIFVGIKVKRL